MGAPALLSPRVFVFTHSDDQFHVGITVAVHYFDSVSEFCIVDGRSSLPKAKFFKFATFG